MPVHMDEFTSGRFSSTLRPAAVRRLATVHPQMTAPATITSNGMAHTSRFQEINPFRLSSIVYACHMSTPFRFPHPRRITSHLNLAPATLASIIIRFYVYPQSSLLSILNRLDIAHLAIPQAFVFLLPVLRIFCGGYSDRKDNYHQTYVCELYHLGMFHK